MCISSRLRFNFVAACTLHRGLNSTQLTGSLPSEWGLGDGFSSIDTM